jgi:S-DNA-T family DNA segregation ATPase FtsK/SpoIIIE
MSRYKKLSQTELDVHLGQFLINSWSYSKLMQFARNEKAFEMRYIYGVKSKISASAIAGSAFHYALEMYFTELRDNGQSLGIEALEAYVIQYIQTVSAVNIKLQKTTPTVEESKSKATQLAIKGLRYFYAEKELITEEIAQILDVEIKGESWLNVNGVDVPLPCVYQLDLIILTKSGKVVVVDHKLKTAYSDEVTVTLDNCMQAVTYALAYKDLEGLNVDEVWFIETKPSENKDKTPQLRKHILTMDDNSIRLYQAQLYEALKRMIQAVQDMDYTYVYNPSDAYVDKAELLDFWAKTMIAEVDDFNVLPVKRDLIANRLRKIRDVNTIMINPKIITAFRENASKFIQYDLSNTNMTSEQKIEHILATFGTIVKVAHVFGGYSSNTYLIDVSAGTKITSVQQRHMEIANALNVEKVRIGSKLTVWEGKSYVSIEVSHEARQVLNFEDTLVKPNLIPLGRDNFQNTVYWDLANHSTPHVLICGATGSGKSVQLKGMIRAAKAAGVRRVVIFDPKYEFTSYKSKGYEVYNEIIEIEEEMIKLVDYMQNLVKGGRTDKVLVIFDEFADAIANSRKGKELDLREEVIVGYYKPQKDPFGLPMPAAPKKQIQKVGELKSLEENLRILAQKGRSVGFRIVTATQRASTKVITGDAKVNFPVQICFRVPKETDSRVVLDEGGAEALMGYGDGLIKSPAVSDMTRFQAFYTE